MFYRFRLFQQTLLASLCVFALNSICHADSTPVDLQCDGQSKPIATGETPKFSWRMQSTDRGQKQNAYQIIVATLPELLVEQKPDLWDSGKIDMPRSPLIAYAGKPLSAGQTCFWKVRVWDKNDKPSPWSAFSQWSVAPTSPEDWQGAVWIDDGKDNPTSDEDFYKPDPAPLMRREFSVEKPVFKARLHIAGLGYCYPSLNGKRVPDHALDPPWTNFEKRILYRTHDVTLQIAEGENCIGLELGNGWYNPLPLRMWGHRNIRGSLPVGRPRAIACLVIDHSDGSQTVVTTDANWTVTDGPSERNSIYLGEVRDARREIPEWNMPDLDDSDWRAVRVTDASLEPLQPLRMHPVRAMEPMPAVAVTSPSPGTYIVDFGTNFTGVPEIDLDLPEGTELLFRYGELLNDDGTLNPMTSVCGQIKRKRENGVSIGGPGAPEIAWQQDVYIAKGGGETYKPDFTFHAFRFMEITGLPKALEPKSVRGIPMHTELPSVGSFSCSNERLNQIQQMCLRTFLANVVTVQSDCPHRERFGYGGDIVATSEAYLMNYDMAGFYSKTVRDWADGAHPDGRFTDTAPFVGIDYCGVGWSMVHPQLLEQLYQHYGSKSLIEEQLPHAIVWFEGEAARRKEGIVTKGLGDHEALSGSRGPHLTTAVFIETARRMARLARIVDMQDKAKEFDAMADESYEAWTAEFVDSATGKVADETQTAMTFALGFADLKSPVDSLTFERLIASLNEPEDGPSLTTGIYGTYKLLEILSREGRSDVAYSLADRNTFPSWGWMLENDATTLWEHWAGSTNTHSLNHPMFGSISAWYFRWLGGIQPADDAVAFDRVVIRPQVVEGLEWVKCSHDSIRGTIQSNWSVTGDGKQFDITIPPDTTATIELQLPAGEKVTVGGKPVEEAAGVFGVLIDNGRCSIFVGSGSYQFVVR